MVWRFGMRLGKHLGGVPARMQSGYNGAINGAVVVVRVPGRAELVEYQQQQDQPARQPMRRTRRRGAQGSPGTGGRGGRMWTERQKNAR